MGGLHRYRVPEGGRKAPEEGVLRVCGDWGGTRRTGARFGQVRLNRVENAWKGCDERPWWRCRVRGVGYAWKGCP